MVNKKNDVMVEMANAGMDVPTISRVLDTTQRDVRTQLSHANAPVNDPKREMREKIVRMSKAGAVDSEIAEATGLNKQSVGYYRRSGGVVKADTQIKKPIQPNSKRDDMLALRKQGYGNGQIATRLRISYAEVVKEIGLQPKEFMEVHREYLGKYRILKEKQRAEAASRFAEGERKRAEAARIEAEFQAARKALSEKLDSIGMAMEDVNFKGRKQIQDMLALMK